MTQSARIPAPEWDISEWIGTPSPLESLRGHVVLVEAFQMLCAGCVNYGIPQAQRVARMFPNVTVVGLHTVFEHHEVTGPAALRVFLQEFGVRFPVAIDRHDEPGGLPVTMRTYGLEGTPSTLLFDKAGSLVFSHLGKVDDLALGVMIGQLIAAPTPVGQSAASAPVDQPAVPTPTSRAAAPANPADSAGPAESADQAASAGHPAA